MTTATTIYTRGDWVRLDIVDGDGEPRSDLHGQIARVLEATPLMSAVRLEGGAIAHVATHELHLARIVAPSGFTGRWASHRVPYGDRHVWVAHAIPVNPHAVVTAVAFDTHAAAFDYATARARENVR